MLWILFLQLVDSVNSFPAAEHDALCTSHACFTLHLDKVNFSKAQQNCEDNGGNLMTIRDREEEEAVLQPLLSQIQGQRQDKSLKFWIGLKLGSGSCVLADRTLRGFQWVTRGEESNYSNWAKEPAPTCTERCVSISYDASTENQLKWTDRRCRAAAFYLCQFYFRGMCQPLAVLGPGVITYTPPFSLQPQKGEMKSFPMGTYAHIFCSDRQSLYSVCTETEGTFGWTNAGPFCPSGEQNCAVNNGGCADGCHQSGDKVTCVCREGYHLGDDGVSCRINSGCAVGTCERECVEMETGYACRCPQGFELHENQHNCTDVDECGLRPCARHQCVNTPGGYTCRCDEGFEMVAGECADVDECARSRCDHSCLNSVGSFSCHCHRGFVLAPDGRSCLDISECVRNPCQPQCAHTEGPGTDCAQQVTVVAEENSTGWLSRTEELQQQSPPPDPHTLDLENATHVDLEANTSLAPSAVKTIKGRVLVCVLGSVVPLVLLIAVTVAIAIFRCSRLKKEAKKTATADGYCWVPPALDPRLEKLYESIRTDDL